jgi:uncharacterized protein YgiM (DUF1202 family)
MKLFTTAITLALLGGFTSSISAAQINQKNVVYSVTRISPSDNLNVRSGAGTNYPVIAVLPFNGKGVIATGKTTKQGANLWTHITWAGVEGWVNNYYLTEEETTTTAVSAAPTAEVKQPTKRAVVMSCVGVEPRWNIHITATSVNVIDTGKNQYSVPVTFRQQSVNHSSIAVVGGKKDQRLTQLFLQKVEACNVGGASYPYSIIGALDERQVVSGCCKVINQ